MHIVHLMQELEPKIFIFIFTERLIYNQIVIVLDMIGFLLDTHSDTLSVTLSDVLLDAQTHYVSSLSSLSSLGVEESDQQSRFAMIKCGYLLVVSTTIEHK